MSRPSSFVSSLSWSASSLSLTRQWLSSTPSLSRPQPRIPATMTMKTKWTRFGCGSGNGCGRQTAVRQYHFVRPLPMSSSSLFRWHQKQQRQQQRFLSSGGGDPTGLPPGMTASDLQQAQQQQQQDPPGMPGGVGGGGVSPPLGPHDGQAGEDHIQVHVTPPERMTKETLDGIHHTMDLFVNVGVANQRLVKLSQLPNQTVVERWQKMMEIYFTTQLQIISNLGYQPDESGLQHYAVQTQNYIETLAKGDQEKEMLAAHFKYARQKTWKRVVSLAFGFPVSDIPELSIVDARNHMHTVTSRMCSPEILLSIQKQVGRITNPENIQQEQIMKHNALQQILVHDVYLGSKLLSELGFENGAKGYAMFQCSISDYEGDPLIQQYQTAAMQKVWDAAGLNVQEVTVDGRPPRATP